MSLMESDRTQSFGLFFDSSFFKGRGRRKWPHHRGEQGAESQSVAGSGPRARYKEKRA